jgi:Ca2+-binding EF-hand superfamily protein
MDEINYLASATCFNAKEIRTWYKDFRKECPQGGLSREQFRNIFVPFHPNGDPTLFANFVFNAFDINKDGQIQFAEFLRCLSVTTRGGLEERLLWAFTLYDINNDGFITFEEMTTIVASMYQLIGASQQFQSTPEERVQAIFQAMDLNRDGLISKEEFTRTSLENPELVNRFLMYEGLV